MAADDANDRPALEPPAGAALVDHLSGGSAPQSAGEHSAANDDKTIISKRPPLREQELPSPQSPQVLGATLVGKRLEHYELSEFVGGGGMGAVFRAFDTRLGRTVAVKVLSRDHTDEETIRRFRNEAQSAARLDHPNIARVYYVGEDHGWNFIVFEFIEGVNLREAVEIDGPLELERALNYTLQVAAALAHSSSRDVVHRDIKPSNVLVTASGVVKLVDMGLARLHQVESSEDLTASGVTLGTFDYISPEQARDPRAADVRSDIYSLGCTLFFMLTGQPPFPDGTALQKLLRHNSDEPPDVRTFRPELHPRVSALLSRMLSKRPSLRPQTPADLSGEIIVLGQQLGLPSVAEFGRVVLVPSAAAQTWWSKAWQVAAAAALLFVAIATMELALAPRQAGGDVVSPPRFKKPRAEPSPAQLPLNPEKSAAIAANDAAPKFAPVNMGQAKPSAAPSPSEAAVRDVLPLPAFPVPAFPLPNEPAPGVSPIAPPAAVAAATLATPGAAAEAVAIAPRPMRIVVLGDVPTPPEPLVEYVSTLAEACERATEVGATEIELRYNGYRQEQPWELTNQRLTVRAAAEHHPAIVFRPQVRAGDQAMIRLAGGSSMHLELEGVELRMELPTQSPSDGWSLFALSTGQSLELTQCVLTVQDGDAERPAIHDGVAMISVRRRRPGETMSMGDSQLAMGQQARIFLDRCVARGEASLVNMADETPLTVRWNQGLLATSKHLLETQGTATEPQYYEQIVLDLDSVTAWCRAGLYYLHRGSGKAYQFKVYSYADNCVFVTDPGTPLFEMVGLDAPPEAEELQSTGEGNRFSPADMPFLFVRAMAGSEPQVSKLGRRWSSETRSQAGVPWVRQPPPDRPVHELAKEDFLIESNPATSGTGFDPLLLPNPAPPDAAAAGENLAPQL